MMGSPDPYAGPHAAGDVVHVDASPDLDDAAFTTADDDADCRVSPLTILEARRCSSWACLAASRSAAGRWPA